MDPLSSNLARSIQRMWTTPLCEPSMLPSVSFVFPWPTTLPGSWTFAEPPYGWSVWWCYSRTLMRQSLGLSSLTLCYSASHLPQQCAGRDSIACNVPAFRWNGTPGSVWLVWALAASAVLNGSVSSALLLWVCIPLMTCGINLATWRCLRWVPAITWLFHIFIE